MADYTLTWQELQLDYGLDVSAIALSTYPIFDETYRAGLNEKIRRHYWLRDIGQETPDVFFFMLTTRMNEIMPYMNDMYKTLQIQFDPLSTYKLSEITDSESRMHDKRTVDQNGNTTSSSTNNTRATAFDGTTTPVSDSGNYAAGKSVSESQTGGTGASESVETAAGSAAASGESRHEVSGRIGDSAELLRSYRAAIVNVDMMVIESLSPVFHMTWNMSDSSTRRNVGYEYSGIYPTWGFFGW